MWPAEEKAGDRRGVRGNESCPLASQLVSLLGLHFLGRQGRGRGGGGGSRAREGPHPLSSVNLAGWSGKVGPKLPLHAGSEGLATFSPNFRGGLLVAAACSRTSLSGHWGGQGRLLSCACGPRWVPLMVKVGQSPTSLTYGWAKADTAQDQWGPHAGTGKGTGQGPLVSRTLQDWCPGPSCSVLSRPEGLPSALCHLGFWPTAHACKRDGEGDLWGQAGHEGRRLRVKQSHTVKKQLRSRWGKTGKGKRGRQRGRGGSGQGGGAALYGQDSSRKAGGESRDVIPQLYPAVTIWGVERVVISRHHFSV